MKKILFIEVFCLLFSISVIGQSKKTWEKTLSLNTITAYEDFLKKYPDGEYSEKAKLKLQELAYDEAIKNNTVKVYEEFLLKYSQSQYVPEVQKNLIKLNLLHDWQLAEEVNTSDAYRNFIKKYPDSYYVSEAKTNIETFDWNMAKTTGTAVALKTFLDAYPESSHAREAKEILKELTIPLLVKAADQNDMGKLKILLSKGENVNAQDEEGMTALMNSCYNGNTEMVNLLMSKNADINIKTKNGFTALLYASYKGNTEIVKLLINKGSEINAETKDGFTALTLASGKGNLEIVKLLVGKGVDINHKNIHGGSAISFSDVGNYYSDSKDYHPEIVDYLIYSALNQKGFRYPTVKEIHKLAFDVLHEELKTFNNIGIDLINVSRDKTNMNIITVTCLAATYGSSMRYEFGNWEINIFLDGNNWKARGKRTD